MPTLPTLSVILTALLTSITIAHPAPSINERSLQQCGSTTYSPDEYYCANPTTGQIIAVLPHGTNGSPLATPQNQPKNTVPTYVSPSPVPSGTIPHEGTVSIDNGGSGTGTGGGNGNGGSGSGSGGGVKKMMKRQQGVQTLPHGVGGSQIGSGQQQPQQQQPQSGDGSVPAGVDPSLGRVHVDGNGGGN